jgi:TPR repeat protein
MRNRFRTAASLLLAAAAALSLPAAADFKAGMDALAVKDYALARTAFEGEPNNAQAIHQLARMARMGLGEPRNDVRRVGLLQRAADLGHLPARHELALALGNGTGVAADPARAVKLLEALDAAGHLDSTVYLGQALRHGWWDLPRDDTRATALFRKASGGGHDLGAALYGTALLQGVGTAADPAQGAALLKASADRGQLDAQLEYARVLTFGLGVAKDEAAGTALYRKIADTAGDSTAQYAVAVAYLNGTGGPRDEAAGARWCDAAARQGHAWAQLRLGELFRTGLGVPRARNHAYYWYTLAARSKSPAGERARERLAVLAREMSAAEIDMQVKRAAAFQPQPGLRPREQALPALARGDRVAVGSVSMAIPAPRGYANNWEFVELLHRLTPNDRSLRPRLMVLSLQEDMDRFKLGLQGPLRSIEFEGHLPDPNMTVSPGLFADIRKEFRAVTERNTAAGSVRVDMLQDDESVFALIRSSTTGERNIGGFALALVNGRVLEVSFTGYDVSHMGELRELVTTTMKEILSRNARSGNLFGSNPP